MIRSFLLSTAIAASTSAATTYGVTDLHTDGAFAMSDDGTHGATVYARAASGSYSTINQGHWSPMNLPKGVGIAAVAGNGGVLAYQPGYGDYTLTPAGKRTTSVPLGNAAGASVSAGLVLGATGNVAGVADYGGVYSLVFWDNPTPELFHLAVLGVNALNWDNTVVAEVKGQQGGVSVAKILNGRETLLPSPTGDLAFGSSIDAVGTVAGEIESPDGRLFHAVLWQAGVMRDLGVLPGDTASGLDAINNHAQAVGLSRKGGTEHAILWDGQTLRNLNTMIAGTSGVQLTEALAITESGQILAKGYDHGQATSFLLNPKTTATAALVSANAVPEPTLLARVAVAAIALRRRAC